MDKTKDYSLYVDGIEEVVSEFVERDTTLKLEILRPDNDKMVCRISKGRATGVVNIYKKKNGLVSLTVQGAKGLQDVCESCCDQIIQRTAIPNSLRKSLTLRESAKDNIEYLKEELTNSYHLTITAKQTGGAYVSEVFEVCDTAGVKVCCSFYNNGTFLLQGNVTPLYVTVMTEALRWLVTPEQTANISDLITLNNTTQIFSEEICELIPNLSVCGDTDGIIERMVKTSVSLFNSGIVVEDYGCYTFGVLKALEGVLKLRLSEDMGTIGTLGDHFHYDRPSRRHRINTTLYDDSIELKKAINKGYTCWASARNSSFHADEQIATSTILSYEQAIEIFNDALVSINEICNYWSE